MPRTKPRSIISIDPGLTTGVAIRIGDDISVLELNPYQAVWKFLKNNIWDQVVCENFTAQNISSYGIVTVRIVGGIECYCTLNNIPLTIQQNIMRIPYKPRALEMLIAKYGSKPPRDHRLDALAHLLRWEHDNNVSV